MKDQDKSKEQLLNELAELRQRIAELEGLKNKRKQMEEKLNASLREKEVLLREIHHRVKNNMQIISSLINLQSCSIRDKKVLEMFLTSRDRIRSMALIHERLYQSKDLARVDFSHYIRGLAVYLFHSYRIDADIIKLKMDVKDVGLDINSAIPCGLIINELVSNSLKYAFPDGKSGEIAIKMDTDKRGKCRLVVKDTGVGFPGKLDFRNTGTLGMQLVNDLVDQIDGTINLDRKSGTEFKIIFPFSFDKVPR